jgi:diguanylate cyclase (GGDEF)-like protein/PAS domain S-box-containing protein
MSRADPPLAAGATTRASLPDGPPQIAAEAVLDGLADVVLVIDTLGSIRYANRATERELGYRLADHVGRSLLELVHPDDVANVISSLETVQAKSVGTPVEVRVRARDGSWHWFEEIGTNVTLDDGTPAVLCAARNITQRRMWEVAAGDVERARQIIHVAPTISILLDAGGVIVSVNAAFTRLLGHDQGAALGRPLSDFVAAADRRDVTRIIAELADGARRATFEADMTVVGQPVDLRPVRFEIVNHLTDPIIAGMVASGSDITELQAARRELEHLARHDSLTGLVSRAHLVAVVDRLLVDGEPFAMLFADLDRFKPVNDRWGHEAGDELLRHVAARLETCVRPDDVVARVGGDEFVMIVRDVDESEARLLARQVDAAISAPYRFPSGVVRIGVSIGVAMPDERSTTDTLLAAADADMYRVKAERRSPARTRRRSVVARRGR